MVSPDDDQLDGYTFLELCRQNKEIRFSLGTQQDALYKDYLPKKLFCSMCFPWLVKHILAIGLFCVLINLLFLFRFYRQFFLFLFYFLISLVCFTLRPGPPPKQAATPSPPLNSTGSNVTTPNPLSNSSTFSHMSSQLRLSDISPQDSNLSLEFYFQNHSFIKNIPLPYRIFSSPDYNDQIGEPFMPTNNTLNSEVTSYLGGMYHRNSSNHTQYSASNKHLNYTGISSHGEEVAEEKRKNTRIKRDFSSQVKGLLIHISIPSLWIFIHKYLTFNFQ